MKGENVMTCIDDFTVMWL